MVAMSKQFKLMLFVNIILGLLFVAVNLIFVYFINLRPTVVYWNPLWLTFYNPEALRTIGDLGSQQPNFSFYFFWVLMIVNVYFIYILQKSEETKHTPS